MLVAMVAHGPGVALFLTNMPVFLNVGGPVNIFPPPFSAGFQFIYCFFLFSSIAKIICLV